MAERGRTADLVKLAVVIPPEDARRGKLPGVSGSLEEQLPASLGVSLLL